MRGPGFPLYQTTMAVAVYVETELTGSVNLYRSIAAVVVGAVTPLWMALRQSLLRLPWLRMFNPLPGLLPVR